MNLRLRELFLAACGLLIFSACASAAAITWDLQNVTFPDGGIVTGSFVYNADLGALGTYSSIDLVTSGGAQPSTTYTFFFNGNSGNLDSSPGSFPVLGTSGLFLIFLNPLTDAGGTIQLSFVGEGTCVVYSDCHEFSDFPNRDVTNAGQVVAQSSTPEPTSLPLAAAGLVALITLSRIRRVPRQA